jgi:Na+/H+ antiporter NhaD/arsenite permease-like protein
MHSHSNSHSKQNPKAHCSKILQFSKAAAAEKLLFYSFIKSTFAHLISDSHERRQRDESRNERKLSAQIICDNFYFVPLAALACLFFISASPHSLETTSVAAAAAAVAAGCEWQEQKQIVEIESMGR